jgi:ElaB/YqjD/DUF883 family membrane-anchored ribosome-binding protein
LEQLTPALDTLEQNARKARRAIAKGRRTAEDAVTDTTRQVRRHPLGALAVAGAAGVLSGCVVGFVLGRRTRGVRPIEQDDDWIGD